MLHLDVLYYNQNKKDVPFKFPVDSKLRRAWTLQIQRTSDKCKGPSEHSALSSEHFTFESTSVLSKKIGLKMNQMIKPDAIPTCFSTSTTKY